MNNPFQLIQMLKGNPQNMMNMVMNNPQFANNPMIKNAMEMYKRGDKEGINRMAENLCRERGINQKEIEMQIRQLLGL